MIRTGTGQNFDTEPGLSVGTPTSSAVRSYMRTDVVRNFSGVLITRQPRATEVRRRPDDDGAAFAGDRLGVARMGHGQSSRAGSLCRRSEAGQEGASVSWNPMANSATVCPPPPTRSGKGRPKRPISISARTFGSGQSVAMRSRILHPFNVV